MHESFVEVFHSWFERYGSEIEPDEGDDHERHARRVGEAFARFIDDGGADLL